MTTDRLMMPFCICSGKDGPVAANRVRESAVVRVVPRDARVLRRDASLRWSDGDAVPTVSPGPRPDGGGVAEQGEATDGGAGPEDRARLAAFGLRIKLLRVSRSWSQEQLAEAAGMHRTFIGQVERGQRGLNVLGLWRLAGAFNIPIGDLFLDVEGRPIP
jgi:DNA-binding XRE family transcriptional regulator